MAGARLATGWPGQGGPLQKSKKSRHDKKQSIDSKVKERARLQKENREKERGKGETTTSRIANHIRKGSGSSDMGPISLTPSPYHDDDDMFEEITLEDHRIKQQNNQKKLFLFKFLFLCFLYFAMFTKLGWLVSQIATNFPI